MSTIVKERSGFGLNIACLQIMGSSFLNLLAFTNTIVDKAVRICAVI